MRQPGDRAPAPAPLTLIQDLANTWDIEAGRDTLRTAEDLAAFCAARGIAITCADDDVVTARALREGLRDACQAHTGADLSPPTRQTLARLFDRAPLTVAFDEAGGARPAPAPGLAGADALVAEIGRAVLDAVAAGTWQRLKACAAHGCRWVYYDHSPGGRSRWCTMDICGARAKMRAYRERKRPG
ncbi:CGNR zinc finger domain-containing protein [Micromonospora sp. ANENR4]|uniref:CGNR zinc finger domain-containing protein n=1 Tax=unclassified Micromonospora TaxID=2617518 RepID=UPI0018908BE8|nr:MULTISPECIES: CGNR zinc finger domain-containing protein [unclassified Micromonospora]MBF5030997.1 CGNR zinc finger domain-containing protein [Micromonospora sp. ANENR4]MCZ7474365.1 CGNR zinc finger domain-containing protein [Micromonospora sp. WMMC273]